MIADIASILGDTGTDIPATLVTVNSKLDTIDTNVDDIETAVGVYADAFDEETLHGRLQTIKEQIEGKINGYEGFISLLGGLQATLGYYEDDEGSPDTISGKTYISEKHIHGKPKCYPSLADPVNIAKASGAWAAHGDPTEIMPDGVESQPFDIHWLTLSGLTIAGNYELKLYNGADGSEEEIACIPFTKDTDGLPIITPIIYDADPIQRISATLSGSPSAVQSVNVKIGYHVY